jgi:hypothetical protein
MGDHSYNLEPTYCPTLKIMINPKTLLYCLYMKQKEA